MYDKIYDIEFDSNPRLYSKEALAAYIRSLSGWGVDNCGVVLAELADRAGLLDDLFDADGDNFEEVIRHIQTKLGIDLGV